MARQKSRTDNTKDTNRQTSYAKMFTVMKNAEVQDKSINTKQTNTIDYNVGSKCKQMHRKCPSETSRNLGTPLATWAFKRRSINIQTQDLHQKHTSRYLFSQKSIHKHKYWGDEQKAVKYNSFGESRIAVVGNIRDGDTETL